ncbi:hypothetical protein B0H13DRAFT_1938134 [Mycena leptocephala]|nr:hypothetical protein B0H13DRAFT_1938134 [Mycena leptocephala]
MVGRRRDRKQRATMRKSLVFRDVDSRCPRNKLAGTTNGVCNVVPSLCPSSDVQVCGCSSLAFVLTGACRACTPGDGNHNLRPPQLGKYSSDNNFGVTCAAAAPSQSPAPTKQVVADIPSWAIAMISATPSPTAFNFDDAIDLAATLPVVWHPKVHVDYKPKYTSSTIQNASSSALSSTSLQPSQYLVVIPPHNATVTTVSPVSGSSKNSSQAGAIAGGIIGAIVLLLLIGLGIWYRIRRRRNHIAPSAAYKAAVRAGNPSPMPYQPVRGHSPKNSTDDLTADRSLWVPSRPVSIRSESRFREHTMS